VDVDEILIIYRLFKIPKVNGLLRLARMLANSLEICKMTVFAYKVHRMHYFEALRVRDQQQKAQFGKVS